MNVRDRLSPLKKKSFQLWRLVLTMVPGGRIRAFGSHEGYIQSIVAINLDRQPGRWRRLQRELQRYRTWDGTSLIDLAHRLSAIDARDGRAVAATADVDPIYRVGDQLFVQPDARLAGSFGVDEPVRMTRQEVAVARSHIEAWKIVAHGPEGYTLILEDDAWFVPSARRKIDRGWKEAVLRAETGRPFGLLYLGYEDAGGTADWTPVSRELFSPNRGFWHLSAYVLSKPGATALLRAMPVVGPVDLWMNYRFTEIRAIALQKPAIAQRRDAASDNKYSVMPFLARAGVVDGIGKGRSPSPSSSYSLITWTPREFAGNIAMALSMLGLRVRVFDEPEVPLDLADTTANLESFDALVNPPLTSQSFDDLIENDQVFFAAGAEADLCGAGSIELLPPARTTLLASDEVPGKWEPFCNLLAVEKPAEAFPHGAEAQAGVFRFDGRFERRVSGRAEGNNSWDDSPWVLRPVRAVLMDQKRARDPQIARPPMLNEPLMAPSSAFSASTETFPGNLALFAPANVGYSNLGAKLSLERIEGTGRPYRSGALASTHIQRYGRFQAEIQAAPGDGVITGFFLHRSMPRQEIDIEFSGADPTRMLINVFFNPGDEGASFDFGYRGTPHWIDLGFDSTETFHQYCVEWRPDGIRWSVDGTVVHERAGWDPTPIPHLAMRLHANLWAPSSQELAGRISQYGLPTAARFRSVLVTE